MNTENKLMVAIQEWGLWVWVKKRKELRSTNWRLWGYNQNSHGDVKYSIGNIVSNIVMIIYGARWVLDLLGITL